MIKRVGQLLMKPVVAKRIIMSRLQVILTTEPSLFVSLVVISELLLLKVSMLCAGLAITSLFY